MVEEPTNKGGRPKGSKNRLPTNTAKIEGKEVEKSVDKAVDKANKDFIAGLSGDMKELYAGFAIRHKLPIDDLRQLAQSMKARYNIGLQSEIQEHETKVKVARAELAEITKSKQVGGRTVSAARLATRQRNLETIIKSKYHITASLTTLSSELKNVFVEIERIEAGQPKGNVNIFNLLKGEGDKEKVDALEEEAFKPDPSILDEDDTEEDPNDN
jgi:hypothetical protein